MSDKPQFVRNALDNPGLSVYGLRNQQTNKTARISIGLFNGNLSISCMPDNGDKPVRLPMDPHSVFELMETLLEVSRQKNPIRHKFNAKGWSKEQKRRDTLGSVYVGRDDNSNVYIAVEAAGQKPTKVDFRTSLNFERVDNEGNPIPASHSSAIAAAAWARLVQNIFTQTFVKDYVHPEPRKPQFNNNNRGNNNGGNYQNRNNNQNNNQSSNGNDWDNFDLI